MAPDWSHRAGPVLTDTQAAHEVPALSLFISLNWVKVKVWNPWTWNPISNGIRPRKTKKEAVTGDAPGGATLWPLVAKLTGGRNTGRIPGIDILSKMSGEHGDRRI